MNISEKRNQLDRTTSKKLNKLSFFFLNSTIDGIYYFQRTWTWTCVTLDCFRDIILETIVWDSFLNYV